MDAVWLGYIFAIISSMFSAIYVVPKKLSKQKPAAYAIMMGVGFFIASTVGFVVLKTFHCIDEPLVYPHAIIACINGVLWMIASVAVLSSIDRIGLAKSNQWKSLQGPIGAFLMMVFFSEFLTTKVIFIILAIVLITFAAMMFSTREKDTGSVDKIGIAYALLAAVFYGLYTFVKKFLTNEGALFFQQIYTSLFVFLSAASYTFIKYGSLRFDGPTTKKDLVLPLLGGVLFFGNASFNVLAYSYIEGSIASMLHQLNAIWLLLIGVFVFKEIDFKKHWLRLAAGLVFSITGAAMLILAKV